MQNKRFIKSFSIGVLAFMALSCQKKDKRPNVIVILADDLGYSDLGCYGGEIQTPSLDDLARNGIRFNRFYNCSRSCPTRASLLTGLYQHQAGIGRMTFNENLPGYRGQLSDNAVTIAEVLKQSGYNTGMVGKWHVAETPLRDDQREWLAHHVQYPGFADKKLYPTSKGFDSFYGVIYGVVNFFDPFSLVNGDEPVKNVPADYYITDALNDTAVAYINRYAGDNKPFFLYLAHTAPHWPLHAKPGDIEKYKSTYEVGWDSIRHMRYRRMKELGVFGRADNFLSPRQFDDRWDENPTREWDARAMAVHAAMVDRMDRGIGRLVGALKKNGQYENTLILFLSDNGCSSEMCQNYPPGDNDRPDMTRDGRPIVYPRQKEVLPGAETSFASIGPAWANVANTPFRYWKAREYEGGICTPLIAHWPAGIKLKSGSITSQMGHVMDIMATCVDLAKASYPSEYNGKKIIPLEGKSLVPVLQTGQREGHDFIAFEHFNEKALISRDGWKIVKTGNPIAEWELYNLHDDRSELDNVAPLYPGRVAELEDKYNQWAERCLVVPAPR
ncbi:MAG: arylsulfatase [Breznakibacter sp.]